MGSRKNNFAILSVEAPDWQGAKAQAYRDMASFRNASRRDASALKIVKLFLREPYVKDKRGPAPAFVTPVYLWIT
jgi:hypothetical protein